MPKHKLNYLTGIKLAWYKASNIGFSSFALKEKPLPKPNIPSAF